MKSPKPKYQDKLKNSKKVLKEFSDTFNYGRSLLTPKPQIKTMNIREREVYFYANGLNLGREQGRASMLQDVLEKINKEVKENEYFYMDDDWTHGFIDSLTRLKAMLTEKK